MQLMTDQANMMKPHKHPRFWVLRAFRVVSAEIWGEWGCPRARELLTCPVPCPVPFQVACALPEVEPF